MARSGARCVHVAARVVCERELNRMMNATRNKGSTLFSITAVHLDCLLRTWGDQDLVIICDRQGGRGHYGGLLRQMFEDWSLEIVDEQESCSEYRLHRKAAANASAAGVRIVFREKAEVGCLPVAYASMVSKYLREAMMNRFNAFWKSQLPQVTPHRRVPHGRHAVPGRHPFEAAGAGDSGRVADPGEMIVIRGSGRDPGRRCGSTLRFAPAWMGGLAGARCEFADVWPRSGW